MMDQDNGGQGVWRGYFLRLGEWSVDFWGRNGERLTYHGIVFFITGAFFWLLPDGGGENPGAVVEAAADLKSKIPTLWFVQFGMLIDRIRGRNGLKEQEPKKAEA